MGFVFRAVSILRDFLVSIGCVVLSIFIRRDKHYIAFGSWCGELYNDNSKYLAEYIKTNHPEFKIYWVGQKKIASMLPSEYEFVEINKIAFLYKLLRCKTFFFTQMHRPDISRYNVYHGATLCLLDHGNTLKKWAMDAAGYQGELEYKNFSLYKKLYTTIMGENHPYRFLTVSSHKTAEAYKTAMLYRMDEKSEIIETGLPRNDALISHTYEERRALKCKYGRVLGFDSDKKLVLYLPTYRRKTEQIESFANRDAPEMRKLNDMLISANAVLLEKNHFAADKYLVNKVKKESTSIIKISQPVDVQELMEIADILISDYSGCILDFLVLDRPLIYYVYDYEEYKSNDSGLYYTIDEYAAGGVAYSFDEVYNELEKILVQRQDDYSSLRRQIKYELATFDDGHSCARVFNKVFEAEGRGR